MPEFHARYCGEKPYFEFWDGQAVQKCSPTRLHSRVQYLLVQMLYALGFEAGSEITVKQAAGHELIPDVIAEEGAIGDPYPTEPFEMVAEILSDDSFSRMFQKCELYAAWGIRQIVPIDLETRLIWTWNRDSLRETDLIARRCDQVITAQALWADVDRLLQR